MKKILTTTAIFVVSGSVFAAASGSVVFDPTNYAKNLITSEQSLQQVQQAIQGNLTKLQQLAELYRQGKAIASGDLNTIAGIVSSGQLQSQLNNLQSMQQAVTQTQGALSTLQGRMDYTMQMSSRYGVTMQQYLANQSQMAARKNAIAKDQETRDKQAIQDVNASYAQLAKFQDTAPQEAAGLLQMLNQQMTLLNRNNAQILEYMVAQSQRQLQKDADARTLADQQRSDSKNLTNDAKRASDQYMSDLDAGIAARKAKYGN